MYADARTFGALVPKVTECHCLAGFSFWMAAGDSEHSVALASCVQQLQLNCQLFAA